MELRVTAGVGGTTAALLALSLITAVPAHAEDAARDGAAPNLGVTISDTPVDETLGEPTVTELEPVAIDAPADYVETPAVPQTTGDAQQQEDLTEAEPDEADAGAVRAELHSDVAVFGVTWEQTAPSRVEYRSLVDGTWTEWAEIDDAVAEGAASGGAPAETEGGGTEPIFVTDTTAIEVLAFTADGQRSDDLTVMVVDPRGEDQVENSLEVAEPLPIGDPLSEAPADATPESSDEPQSDEPVAEESAADDSGAEGPETQAPTDTEPAAPGAEIDITTSSSGPLSSPDFVFASTTETSAAGQADTALHTGAAEILQTNVKTGYGLTIKSRKAWGANEDWRKYRWPGKKVSERWESPSTKYQGAVVHHTAGTNDYSKAQVPAIIQGIYRYHTQGVYFGDVGYQLLVDKYGGVWEGRYDSLKRSLVGAQALGANKETFGISVLGTFTKTAPSAKAQDSTARAIAYMFNKYKISNPKGKIRIPHSNSKGATVPKIMGHYQTFATACPGAAFIDRLPALRNKVVQYLSPFIDVKPGDKHATHIIWMGSKGIAKGSKTDAGYVYGPSRAISRGEMAVFLYRLHGRPKVKLPKSSPFADVSPSHSYYPAIVWMHQQGLSTGVKQPSGKPHYKMSSPVTRESMAVFMYRMDSSARKYKAPKKSPFRDVSPGDKHYRIIAWMGDSGLSTGTKHADGTRTYRPKANVTRGETAVFLYRSQH